MSWFISPNSVTSRETEFLSLEAYNNHCLNSHPKQPMYPELSLIEKSEAMEPKGNPWEC